MKRLIAFMIIMALVMPSFALAVEAGAKVEANAYAFSFFGYTIIIAAADANVQGDSATFAIIKDADNEMGELLANYRLGNTFGRMVSTMARVALRPLSDRLVEEKTGEETTEDGLLEEEAEEKPPTHGQIVSAFVHELIRIRREARETEKAEAKEELKLKIQERVRDRIKAKSKIHDPNAADDESEGIQPSEEDTQENENAASGRVKIKVQSKNRAEIGWTDDAQKDD